MSSSLTLSMKNHRTHHQIALLHYSRQRLVNIQQWVSLVRRQVTAMNSEMIKLSDSVTLDGLGGVRQAIAVLVCPCRYIISSSTLGYPRSLTEASLYLSAHVFTRHSHNIKSLINSRSLYWKNSRHSFQWFFVLGHLYFMRSLDDNGLPRGSIDNALSGLYRTYFRIDLADRQSLISSSYLWTWNLCRRGI